MSNPTYRRTQPIAAYLVLLLMTVGGYYLYNQTVVPMIQVPIVKSSVPAYEPVKDDTDHHKWFKPGDWETLPCAVMLTSHGKILLGEFSRIDPKTWEVKPFTLLLDRQNDPEFSGQELPPIILRSEDGATLHFSQSVTGFSKSNVQLKSADLKGHVELYRRTADGSGNEDFRIETSNVHVDHQHVTTIDDVAFWFGNNHGIGRQMSLQLSHNSPEFTKNFSAINGITGLRLSLLSSMQLRPTSQSNKQPGKISNRMFANDNAPIHIETNGPFEFDFKSNLARFSQQVTVKKMDQFSDQVSCAELLLKFKSTKKKSFIELDAASDNEYELQSIVAKGNDLAPAILTARSQNAQVKADLLKYDLPTQIVQATDTEQVTLQRGDTHFVSKSITYQLTEDKTLGQLSAIGPGQIIKQDPANPFRATWAKQLNIKRRNKQQHLIQLQGKSHLQLAGDTHLNANRINLIVWEVPVPDQNGNFARWSYQPAELTANKRVHVSSDKLIADAQQLHATWPENPKAIQHQIQPENIIGKLQTHPATPTHLAMGQTVRRVSYKQIQAEPNDSTLIAKGQRIEIVVLDDDNQKSKITDLQMTGDVTVNKPSTNNKGQNELMVTGDTLRMVPTDRHEGKNYRVKVSGTSKLARILTEQFQVDGQEIFLDQVGNNLWIKGQGQVIIENQSRTNATDSLSDSQMNIRFAGGMIFDGQSIYFEQSVLADVKQHQNDGISHTLASGNALKITLDQKIQFAKDSDARKSKPQIVQMIFQNALAAGQSQFQLANFQRQQPPPDVLIKNTKTDKSGQVVEKLHLRSRRAEMNRANDQLIASGPGSVEVYRKSDGQSGLGFVGKSNDSNENSITYIHIHFDNLLQTGLNSQDMAINGNIRSIYVPVENFEQRFDPTNPVKTPPGTVRLFCNQMEMSQSKNPLSPNPKSQFTATGNAQISADQFASRGDRIRYRQDTENITIESLDGRNITLRTRANAQSRFEGQEIVGSRLIYNLQTKSASVQNVESLSASFSK